MCAVTAARGHLFGATSLDAFYPVLTKSGLSLSARDASECRGWSSASPCGMRPTSKAVSIRYRPVEHARVWALGGHRDWLVDGEKARAVG